MKIVSPGLRFSALAAVVLSNWNFASGEGAAMAAAPAAKLTVEPGHPWTPPFGLNRVGRPLEAVVEVPNAVPSANEYAIVGYRDGKETSRRAIRFMASGGSQGLCFGRVALDDWPSEVALVRKSSPQAAPTEITRAEVKPPMFEAEAVARPELAIHPVDLAAVFVPEGWLLLTSGQRATLEVAALNRSPDSAWARISAWYESTSEAKTQVEMPLKRGIKASAKLELAARAGALRQDKLHVMIGDDEGKELWRKIIPVMIVPNPPPVPRFGAVETKLRYDPPIPASYSPFKINYDAGWDPQLKDIVVFLPNGARFVLWRGSSYCPFWASRSNTGLCYEWAEINGAKHQTGCIDCVEPLMDKELRYGRVKIVESTPARVHVRWDYQSCDLQYKVWGEFASEDYYFYPDGFGTRVMTVTSRTGSPLENQEFIILLPQSGYPFQYLSDAAFELLWPQGKAAFKFPCRPGIDGQDEQWGKLRAAGKDTCLLHRVRFGKDDPLAAVQYSPLGSGCDLPGFGPLADRGAMVTPMYWGHHWPLSRGYPTGWAISPRIHETPAHSSAYHSGSPKPLREQTGPMRNALGETHEMTRKTFYWLIGATDADDDGLRRWMQSSGHAPAVDLTGASKDAGFSAPERRALCLVVENRKVTIAIKPDGWCVNPVFELRGAPKELIRVSLAGQKLDPKRYAWDGNTLWLEAALNQPATLQLEFGRSPNRP